MPTHARMVWAVFKRNFSAYFINPTGYVFITVFILLGAIAAFWQADFFLANLANLDQLNEFYPILLLFFVPALTMGVWAEERKQGTDELLFTLPGHDLDIVLGKYLAVLGIYTVAVLFSISHVVILAWLGAPDIGLMFSTYVGYWLTGAALLTVGMVASLLTPNATVAFILGAMLCAIFVFVDRAEVIFSGRIADLVRNLGVVTHFRPFGDGLIPLTGVFYFLALAAVMLYVNVLLVGRRHFGGGEDDTAHTAHLSVRTVAIAAMAVAAGVLLSRGRLYVDSSAERLHTLQPQTETLLAEIPEDRPVFIQAFFSKDAPESLVQVRKNLVNLLHRFDTVGGDRVRVAIHEVEPFTELAADAASNYNIVPQKVLAVEASQRSAEDVFLGLVFTSGPEEFVIPFFDRGLPVEYELARSVRVVSAVTQRKLGVVATDAKLFGGFDFQSMAQSSDWSMVRELRKQYEVTQVAPGGPYPDDLDALLVILPSSLAQPEMDALKDAILAGTPTLLIDDPLPLFNPQLSPRLPKDAGRNPFMNQGRPPAPPKGDLQGLLDAIGLTLETNSVVWSSANPHPAIAEVAPEIVFVARSPDNPSPFNEESVISSGLQEVVAAYPGFLRADPPVPGASLTYTPLLQTGTVSGDTPWTDLVGQDFFGMQLRQNPRRYRSPSAYTLAMHVQGTIPSPAAPPSQLPDEVKPAGETTSIDVIAISDVDIVSETFFNLRRQGFEDLNFDNVTFVLNCIDMLAGDERFVALRKHRPRHRSLTRVEQLNEVYAERRREETEAAEARAADQLAQAQQRLDQSVQAVREREDLDQQTRAIMLRNLESVENRRLEVVKANIGLEKEKSIDRARTEMKTAVAAIHRNIKWWATIPPPVPTLVLAIGLFAYRHRREKIGASERRLVRSHA